ncbi:phosphatidylserine decarboxylase [Arcobacter sp. LA11]|uniref:phosphatidylserine decarboxylase n=1 Tax=Arcobacter sp. LA11 TaxID=1898176 RepID=UPI0009326A4C|nr:phosphatidylserine decarboxylase [Arcobacter sp. LA11]
MFDSIIAKEGQKSIFLAFIAMLVFILAECSFLAFISFALVLIFIFIYRNNALKTNSNSNGILSPISGVVSAIDVKDRNKLIYIDVSLCNTHILRALEDGAFKLSYKRGLNLFLSTFKAKVLNEKATIEFENSTMELISSMCNTTIDIKENNNSLKGERIGVFLQGQIIVTIKPEFELSVKIGDKLESGVSIIANKIDIEKKQEENI